MTSALIVEDGTGVTNANSYASITDLGTYATLRGLASSLPATDAGKDAIMIKAMDYIEGQRARFKGVKTDEDQALQWPRSDVWIDGALIGSDYIPRELFYAQLALAIEAISNDLLPNVLPQDAGAVISKEVGEIKIAYAQPDTGSRSKMPAFSKADALLAVLYKQNGLFAVRA